MPSASSASAELPCLPAVQGGDRQREQFLEVYREHVKPFLLNQATNEYECDADRRAYLEIMMDNNTLGGKYNRGITVIDIVECLTEAEQVGAASRGKHEQKRGQLRFLAAVAGWMIELLQAYFLVEDDIMDKSKMRRGRPCWYLNPGVTTQSAINDGLILFAWASQLGFYFFERGAALGLFDRQGYDGQRVVYELMKLFHLTNYRTTLCQFYDVTSMRDGDNIRDPTNEPQRVTTTYAPFSEPLYKRIVRHKTAFYTYYLPLAMGFLIAGVELREDGADSPSQLRPLPPIPERLLRQISFIMGEYFQAQDDVMDCFTDPAVLGKVGTDIQDLKCSWLAVQYLKLNGHGSDADGATEGSTDERDAKRRRIEVFKQNYGKDEDDKIAAIKNLYSEAKMPELFQAYEERCEKQCEVLLGELGAIHKLYECAIRPLWNKTYKRKK